MLHLPTKSTIPGPVFALSTALLFGSSVPLAKVCLNQIQPWMLAGLMFLGGGLGLLPIYLIRNWIRPSKTPLERQDWGYLSASSLAGGVIAPVLLTLGLVTTPAGTASLLLNFEGVFTGLLAWTIFREKWQWSVFFGIVAITGGGMILSYSEHARVGFSVGAIAILGTCCAWAFDSNFTKQIADKDPIQTAMLKSIGAGVINITIALSIGQTLPPFLNLLAGMAVGFLSSGLAYVLFILALRQMGASRAGAYLALSPFAGAAIAIVFLKEPITISLVVAAIFMAFGAILCVKAPNPVS